MANPADQGWGIIQEDYTWSGMVGEVGYGGADIAIRSLQGHEFIIKFVSKVRGQLCDSRK